MKLTSTPFVDADLFRLQRAVSQWNRESHRGVYVHIGELPHRIYENLRSCRAVGDLVQLWTDEDVIVGVTIALRFGSTFDALVAPVLRDTEAERVMVRHAAAVTAQFAKSAEEYVGTDVCDCDELRVAVLQELGFEQFRIWDDFNGRGLSESLPAVQLPSGFQVRDATMSDADELAQVRNSAFDEDWTGDQYRAAVMEKPGYDCTREIVVQAPDGRIAAFAVYWIDELNNTGHFEPVGTHRDFQRKGLARAVMIDAMRRMKKQGMLNVTVSHDAENDPARRLYASLGFSKQSQTLGFRISAEKVRQRDWLHQ